jgi:hypothetical protein
MKVVLWVDMWADLMDVKMVETTVVMTVEKTVAMMVSSRVEMMAAQWADE